VRAGLAVTVATESTLESGLAAIDAHHALPVLPEIKLSLHRQARGSSSATTRLWTIIQDTLGAA